MSEMRKSHRNSQKEREKGELTTEGEREKGKLTTEREREGERINRVEIEKNKVDGENSRMNRQKEK
uniref:Uncharacterized protein n=1 Tax=Octopus bimaculoides TaxID=37653 RepID=A0A0L8HJC5_OCTBM